jgi:hypothetical protein
LIYIFLAADKLFKTRLEPCFWVMLVGAVHPFQTPCFSLFSYPIAWLEGLGVWFILYCASLGAEIDCFPWRWQCASVRVWWVRAPQLCGGWTSFLRKADDVAAPCALDVALGCSQEMEKTPISDGSCPWCRRRRHIQQHLASKEVVSLLKLTSFLMRWKLMGVTRLWGISMTDWKSWEEWNILRHCNDFHHMTHHFALIENHCSLAECFSLLKILINTIQPSMIIDLIWT